MPARRERLDDTIVEVREAPPVSPTQSAQRTNLWAHGSAFVGRVADLAELRSLLDRKQRLVTITGPGGMGKTRLALECGLRHGESYTREGGVWFCDLTEATDCDAVCAIVARVLGVPLTANDPTAVLGHVIAGRGRLLLILDNCEQTLPAVAELIAQWFPTAPHAHFVLTSRERLRHPDEVVLELAPLEATEPRDGSRLSDAVQLLVDRATRVRRGFSFEASDVPTMSALTSELDGIPLAIEIAAPSVAAFGVAEVLRRLQQRFDLLDGGARRVRAREATLRGSLDWSWDLLEPRERSVLCLVSVFRGGFTLSAAEAVADIDNDPTATTTADVILSLCDKSMLTWSRTDRGEARYGCFVSVREYAREKLTPDQGRSAEARHRNHYLRVAETWATEAEGEGAATALEQLRRERENMWAIVERGLHAGPAGHTDAARALLALSPPSVFIYPVVQVLARLRQVLQTSDLEPRLSIRCRIVAGMAERLGGRLAEAADAMKEALGDSERHGYTDLSARARATMALLDLDHGRWREAEAKSRAALAGAEAANDLESQLMACIALGVALRDLGLRLEAVATLERASQLARESGRLVKEVRLLSPLARIYLDLNQTAEARRCSERSATLVRDLVDPQGRMHVLLLNVTLELDCGNPQAALRWSSEAVSLCREYGFARFEWWSECLGAIAEYESGAVEAGVAGLRAALARSGANADLWLQAEFQAWLSAMAAASGGSELAAESLAKAERALPGPRPEWLQHLIDIAHAHSVAADALVALRAGDEKKAGELRNLAEAGLGGLAAFVTDEDIARHQHTGVRIALRQLRRALSIVGAPGPNAREPVPVWSVHEGGDWSQPPRAERIRCRARSALHAILRLLVRGRSEAAGEPVSASALVAAAWPGEKLASRVAKNRLHAAVKKLRGLGLREVLVLRDDGYALDPGVPMQIVTDEEFSSAAAPSNREAKEGTDP